MSAPRRYPPTPWINAVHPLTEAHYKFRISRTRADGKLTVTFAKDSPAAANVVRCKPPASKGWWEFVSAARRLLDTSEWNPKINPESAYRQAQWNRDKQDFTTNTADVTTIVAMLPQLIDPKHNPMKKMLQDARKAAAARGGTNVSHVAARNARFAQIIEASDRVVKAIHPIRERMQDGRKMKGYNTGEVQAMLTLFDSIHKAAQTVARMARTNTFVNLPPAADGVVRGKTSDPTPLNVDLSDFEAPADTPKREPFRIDPSEYEDTPALRATPVLLDETLPGFDDGGPLSPDEHKIARHIPRVIVGAALPEPTLEEMFYPGTRWHKPDYMRSVGYTDDEIVESQRIGRERGIIPEGDAVAPMSRGFSFEPE